MNKNHKNDLKKIIKANLPSKSYRSGDPIRLQELPIDEKEILEGIESLISTFVVMGEKCLKFEKAWSNWLGRKHSVFVNSGTSGILLAMMWLKFHKATKNKNEILIPAVTWSTSLFPAIIVGLKPVLVDIDLNNLCVNSFEKHITKNTLAFLPVHLMGHSCNMDKINKEAKKHNIIVIEDCCEAHGAKFKGKKVGTTGDVSVFSYMFAHHIITIEGGMISVNNEKLADIHRMFRAHGWIREISEKNKKKIISENPDIHPTFLFPELGLNLRPTEISAAFGIHQIKKLDNFIKKRRVSYFKIFNKLIKYDKYLTLFPENKNEYLSPFAFPILVKKNKYFT